MDIDNGKTLLILGGARSGKSAFGEAIARASSLDLHYVATATAGDEEMSARISAHRKARGKAWITHEVEIDICRILTDHGGKGSVLMIDCLTLWLSNLMEANHDVGAQTQALVKTLGRARGAVIVISNEVGAGIVPGTAMGRAFRDAQGVLNQCIAGAADNVVLVTAGLPMALKSDGRPNHG